MRWPKLPTKLSTMFGEINVQVLKKKKAEKLEAFGTYDAESRTISVIDTGNPTARWQTFYHELVHVALWDAGIHNILTEPQHEAVADAVGAFLTQMMISGQLKIKPNWRKDEEE